MTLKEKISSDYILAFKAKDLIAKNLLSVIKGEIQTIEKNTISENLSDCDVIKILSKASKGIKETMESTSDKDKLDSLRYEMSILDKYLPEQMSREEIASKINILISSGITSIGDIMKEFSSTSADKRIVSEIARESIPK